MKPANKHGRYAGCVVRKAERLRDGSWRLVLESGAVALLDQHRELIEWR